MGQILGFIKIFIYIGIRQILAIFKYLNWNWTNIRLASWAKIFWLGIAVAVLLNICLWYSSISRQSLNLTTYMRNMILRKTFSTFNFNMCQPSNLLCHQFSNGTHWIENHHTQEKPTRRVPSSWMYNIHCIIYEYTNIRRVPSFCLHVSDCIQYLSALE